MIAVPPGLTSFKIDVMFNDTSGNMISLGNVTNSGFTANYHLEGQTASQSITILQGTLGTWASGTLVTFGTTNTNIGMHQFCPPDAAIPSAFGQKCSFYLANGTAASQAMVPYSFSIIGGAFDTNGRVVVASGTVSFAQTVGQNGTGGSITGGTITSAPAPTSGTITLVQGGSVNYAALVGQNGTGGSVTAGTITSAPAPTSGTITLVQGGSINYAALVGQNGTGGSITSGTITSMPAITSGTITLVQGGSINFTQTVGQNGTGGSITNGTITSAPSPTSGTITLVQSGSINYAGLVGQNGTGGSITAGTITSMPAITSGTITLVQSGSINYAALVGQNGTGGSTTATNLTSLLATDTTQFSAHALALAPTGGGGSGLSGPNTITVNFSDANLDPVSNVEFTVVGQGVGRGNSFGIATFGLPTDTTSGYTLQAGITDGVLFPSSTFTVSGDTVVNIVGQAAVTPTPLPGQSIGQARCINMDGSVRPNAIVTVVIRNPPVNGTGLDYPGGERNFTSGSDGVAYCYVPTGEVQCQVRTARGWQDFVTPASDSNFDLPSIVGP